MHKDLPYNIASYSCVCMLLQWLLHTQSTYIGEHERLATQHSYSYSSVCMLLQWLLHTQSTYIGEHERLATQHSYSYSCVHAVTVAPPHTIYQPTQRACMKDLPHNIASYSSVCMLL